LSKFIIWVLFQYVFPITALIMTGLNIVWLVLYRICPLARFGIRAKFSKKAINFPIDDAGQLGYELVEPVLGEGIFRAKKNKYRFGPQPIPIHDNLEDPDSVTAPEIFVPEDSELSDEEAQRLDARSKELADDRKKEIEEHNKRVIKERRNFNTILNYRVTLKGYGREVYMGPTSTNLIASPVLLAVLETTLNNPHITEKELQDDELPLFPFSPAILSSYCNIAYGGEYMEFIKSEWERYGRYGKPRSNMRILLGIFMGIFGLIMIYFLIMWVLKGGGPNPLGALTPRGGT